MVQTIADYLPCIGPCGTFRSTSIIQCLAKVSFETKHPIILDSGQLLKNLFPMHLHFAHNHQHLGFFPVHTTYALASWALTDLSLAVVRQLLSGQTTEPISLDLRKNFCVAHKV